mmetsp:Transcript_4123/g.9889  ORF Transcript_4123/g.9889 Transcript_4123/m.9889 type:complete len:169 (+) Transcript_4123:361-867(+)
MLHTGVGSGPKQEFSGLTLASFESTLEDGDEEPDEETETASRSQLGTRGICFRPMVNDRRRPAATVRSFEVSTAADTMAVAEVSTTGDLGDSTDRCEALRLLQPDASLCGVNSWSKEIGCAVTRGLSESSHSPSTKELEIGKRLLSPWKCWVLAGGESMLQRRQSTSE